MTDLAERLQVDLAPAAQDQPAGSGQPAEFAGAIGIEWPAACAAGQVIPAWRIAFWDEAGWVTTISRMTLHAECTGVIWAELTMFADTAGKPLLHLPGGAAAGTEIVPLDDDGQPVYGTFPFLVTSMRVKGA